MSLARRGACGGRSGFHPQDMAGYSSSSGLSASFSVAPGLYVFDSQRVLDQSATRKLCGIWANSDEAPPRGCAPHLSAWYLMLPPMSRDGFPDTGAPLRKWVLLDSFDSELGRSASSLFRFDFLFRHSDEILDQPTKIAELRVLFLFWRFFGTFNCLRCVSACTV